MNFLRKLLLVATALLLGCAGCDDLGDPANENCGDGVRDTREVCDGRDLAGASCVSLGFSEGDLACAPGCAGYVVAGCSGLDEPDPCAQCGADEFCEEGECVLACAEPAWTTDGVHDFDVAFDTVRIELLMDGEPMPPASDIRTRGELVLTGAVWWDPLVVPVPATGDAVVEFPAYQGTYSVRWRPGEAAVAEVAFREELRVEGPVETTFDIAGWSLVRGTLSFPDGYDPSSNDRIVFDHRDGDIEPVFANIDAGGGYEVFLREGPHELWWAREDPPIVVHVGTMERREERFDLELPLGFVDVSLTVDGTAPPVPEDKLPSIRLDTVDRGPPVALPGFQRWSGAWVELDSQGSGRALVRDGEYLATVHGSVPPLFGSYPLGPVMADGRPLAFDVDVAPVSGTVLRNGRRLPNSDFDGAVGLITFLGTDGGFLSIPISDRGQGEFQTALPTGSWDAQVSGNYWSGALPVVPFVARRGVVVDSDGLEDLEIDVPAVRFSGAVTANGERLANDEGAETRGTLEVRRADESIWHSVPLPPTGPAGFELVLAPGEYEFGIVRWWFGTDPEQDPPAGALPFGSWLVGSVDVQQATRRDVDVRLYEVEVGVRYDGAPLGEGSRVWFEDREVRRVARSALLDADGTARTTLYPGRYEVIVQPAVGEPFVLDHSLVIEGDRSIEFDLSRIAIDGRVTLAGAEVDRSASPGTLAFFRVPGVASEFDVAALEPPAASYSASLVEGHYTVLFQPSEEAAGSFVPSNSGVVFQSCIDSRIAP